MIAQEAFLKSLHPLKKYLLSDQEDLQHIIQRAQDLNPWFTTSFTRHAIDAIANEFLNEENCKSWLHTYNINEGRAQKVAIIMAGNVPLVGFHDLFCVLASGHQAIIKLSDKDSVLLKFIVDVWNGIEPSIGSRISYSERLESYDAVIATGSNNSNRYFEYYFRDHPYILRRNRNGIAVLNGQETDQQLKELAKDIFLYYGLGCRNVSKLYVHRGYDFKNLQDQFEDWKELSDHNKYRNNLDYNYAIYIINQVPHIQVGHLILKEDEAIASRIGCVHYSYYDNDDTLAEELSARRNEIQCLVSVNPVHTWDHVLPGQTQYPSLYHYADGVDTMQFLTSLTPSTNEN